MSQAKVANEFGLRAVIDWAVEFASGDKQVQLGQVLTRQVIDDV